MSKEIQHIIQIIKWSDEMANVKTETGTEMSGSVSAIPEKAFNEPTKYDLEATWKYDRNEPEDPALRVVAR